MTAAMTAAVGYPELARQGVTLEVDQEGQAYFVDGFGNRAYDATHAFVVRVHTLEATFAGVVWADDVEGAIGMALYRQGQKPATADLVEALGPVEAADDMLSAGLDGNLEAARSNALNR